MNKLNPRNKICFQNNQNIHRNLKLLKLKSKKWNFFKKKLRYKKEIKPEKRQQFFQKRLFEKQQFRNFYGCIHEYQLKNILRKLSEKDNKINIFQKFVVLLESRLDINLVRLKLAKTIFQAKQLINHKKIKINDKIISKPNFLLKKGDIIFIIKNYKYVKKYKKISKKKIFKTKF
uniref:ribosomal protein S4 n=1 Tax=Peronosclerospora sorghi TaxID=230839 RepID=UPI0022FD882C|nr:ribosomal protein S4 [Peronosclerospora sorghi]WAU47949.1 ribosomal protein S4 [Peronosclerospora sorghi]